MRLPKVIGLLFAAGAGIVQADEYVFADHGRATLAVTNPYITDSRLTSPVSSVGVGYVWGSGLAVEVGFHDLGTYRAVGSKDVSFGTDLKIGPFVFPLHASASVPGYAEVRVYGESLGVKYQSDFGFFLKAAVVYVTAEGELHTPVGYSMETRHGALPMGSVGFKFGKVKLDYQVAPKMSIISLGVQVNF